SQMKAIVVPVVIAAGILTTGASVMAFQRGGLGGAASTRPPRRVQAQKAASSTPIATTAADDLLQSDLQAARSQLERLRKIYTTGIDTAVIDQGQYYNESLNLLELERLAAADQEGERRALESHRARLEALIKDLRPLSQIGRIPASFLPRLET